MFNSIKFNALGRRRSAVLCGFVFTSFLALLPAAAEAQCRQWDVSGKWNINITGGVRKGAVMKVELQQSGNEITGGTEHSGATGVGTLSTGTLKGNKIGLVFEWKGMVDLQFPSAAPLQMYAGEIAPDGRIAGEARIFSDRTGDATWVSDRPMKCADRSPTTPPPSDPPMKTPWITASQVLFRQPNGPTGFSILKWDAGPEHPDAELWVKVDDGVKTLVSKVRAGGREITAERDRRYLYTLTAAGTTLATVTVTSNPVVTTPGIVASQATFPPYSLIGYVVLTWDAGLDHPYAEVWFKVNNGEEVFLVEKGKGSHQVMVERGKYYTYILTDAGKTLSTVSFVAH